MSDNISDIMYRCPSCENGKIKKIVANSNFLVCNLCGHDFDIKQIIDESNNVLRYYVEYENEEINLEEIKIFE
ncbi:MAG TPA: hypothetical protein VF941_17705 [Clostridia bacterium]